MTNQSDKYYFNHPDVWEKIRSRGIRKEIDFIMHFLKDKECPAVLDLGSGSGMHTEALRVNGCNVTGIDLNCNMVQYARKHYPNNTFLQLGMAELSTVFGQGSFDAVVCACTTFCYNTTFEAIGQTLDEVRRVLNNGGVFIFDVFNPIAYLQSLEFTGNFFGESQEDYDSLGLQLDVTHTIEERTQLLHETKVIMSADGRILGKDHTVLRMFFPQELVFLLMSHGFGAVSQFGKYRLDYTSLDAARIVTVAYKAW